MNLEEYRKLGFNKYQLQEIQRGYNEGVNVLKYADKNYSHAQMHQIRLGLLNGDDITQYVTESYNYAQMKEVRLTMQECRNPEILVSEKFDSCQMSAIRSGLEMDIDVSLYANPKLSYYRMLEAKNALIWFDVNRSSMLELAGKKWTLADSRAYADDTAFLLQEENSDIKAIAFWKNDKLIMNVHGFDDYQQPVVMQNDKQRLFVDMDGTLAEFKSVDTLEKLYEKNYFASLNPHENVILAIKEIIKHNPEIEVNILSSVLSDSKYALEEKNQWLDIFLPEIDKAHRLFPPCGMDKKEYIKGGVHENDFLLDDYTQNLTLWQPPARGIKLLNGINHTRGTWEHDCLRIDKDPSELAKNIVSIMHNGELIRDEKPQKRVDEALNQDYQREQEFDEEMEM